MNEELYKWIPVGDNKVCSDCLRLGKKEPITMKQWQAIGTPRQAGTLCNGYCRCMLIPVSLTEEDLQKQFDELLDEAAEKAISGIRTDIHTGGVVKLKDFEQYEGFLDMTFERVAYMEQLIVDWKFKPGDIDNPLTLPKEFFKLADVEDMISWLKGELKGGSPIHFAPVSDTTPGGRGSVQGSSSKDSFKSIKQTEEILNCKISTEKGVSKTNIKEVLNTVMKERERLFKKYPKLSKLSINELRLADIELHSQGAIGLYDEASNTLWIHSKSGTRKAIEVAKRRSKLKMRSSTVSDAGSIYRHELGHVIQQQLLSEADIWTIRDEFLDVNEGLLSSEVSKYAVTDPEEAFAEMFGLIVSGKKTSFKVLPKMFKIIMGVLK